MPQPMPRRERRGTSLQVQGWVEGEAAKALFAGAGQDLAALRKQARSAKFKPVELKGASFSAAFTVLAANRSLDGTLELTDACPWLVPPWPKNKCFDQIKLLPAAVGALARL